MHNQEHQYKILCARLNARKKQLLEELKSLNEQLVSQAAAGSTPPTTAPQNGKMKQKQDPKKAIESPVKNLHGLQFSGLGAEAQEDILKNYSDNPETQEVEQPKDASWQSVNSAVGNYMSQQVQKLAQSQRMQ
jgi:hypothetical protein